MINEDDIIRRAKMAISRFDNLRIVGAGWAGNSRQGFQFNPESGLAGAAAGSTPPPVTPTGACCPEDGDCFISTQSVCEGGGGTYQGDGVPCSPDPCVTPFCCPLAINMTFYGITGFCPSICPGGFGCVGGPEDFSASISETAPESCTYTRSFSSIFCSSCASGICDGSTMDISIVLHLDIDCTIISATVTASGSIGTDTCPFDYSVTGEYLAGQSFIDIPIPGCSGFANVHVALLI